MAQDTSTRPVGVGFRVKSGLAIGVLAAGSDQAPQLLERHVLELCDPAIPESRQPHHAGMGTLQTDEAKVERLRKIIFRATRRSVADLMSGFASAGHQLRAASLVVGSDIDPARITNPHIRAHALEGRLFRTVLEEALHAYGLPCSVLVERRVCARAGEILERSEQDVKKSLVELSRQWRNPWRSDEKVAAVAAWLALA